MTLFLIYLYAGFRGEKEVIKGNNNKPRSESVPVLPRDIRFDSRDSSIDLDNTNPKSTNPSNNKSDSDSDCYVGPLELQHAVSMSYTEGMEHHKHSDKILLVNMNTIICTCNN